MGIRDEGTALKPIEIDPTPVKDDSDDDMEEVVMYVDVFRSRQGKFIFSSVQGLQRHLSTPTCGNIAEGRPSQR